MTATTATAPPALLHGVGDRALMWLDNHREHFRLTPEDRATGRGVAERLKPIGELALNMRVLFREGVAGSRQHARAGQLLDFTWRELLDGGNVLAALQHDEPFSPVPLEIYSTFHELGFRHPALESAVDVCHHTRTWPALDMVPNRRLSVLGAERRIGLPPSADFAEAVNGTWLSRLPEPWTVQYHIAYDITHTVFHLTDWGAAPDRIPPETADYLALYLPAWLEDWADLEHWDLLGELLVVDTCLPRPALDAQVWERYAAAQSETGAMPLQHGMPDGDPDDVFDTVHHPTLVAAFASAMATSRAMSAT
ncbi:hypothetical protein BGM19_16530 [Streptomyces agglomeratus]|uniref:DUF6895 domain-containing protein n=1 Tax=Streptomyces agglomeratus TaxID=285458 RepID=A0A1E5PAC4_9ACTN|nr:hypothetical protein [Streptomyces agglomeratus]OEJ26501.1 hypothetical protein AS594_20420 [Streptomyces agglomeratus]OEJ51955.1 hypothetical protein BGK72_15435 [Streptomyces agglomeratus]OEJ59355.1 hypothetical protein BGM19_16530 [Streptomyces agglomeratus]